MAPLLATPKPAIPGPPTVETERRSVSKGLGNTREPWRGFLGNKGGAVE